VATAHFERGNLQVSRSQDRHSLGLAALLPKQGNAEIMVAGARYTYFRRRRALRRAA
jgi:hypothetical protein